MSDEELKRLKTLCANWRKTAKWYRGKGFRWNDEASINWRQGQSKALDQCADELGFQIKKAKK